MANKMFKLTRNCEDMNKNCKKFYFISISLEKLGSLVRMLLNENNRQLVSQQAEQLGAAARKW